MDIVIQGVLTPYEGYGYLAIETIRSLAKAGHNVMAVSAPGYAIYRNLEHRIAELIVDSSRSGHLPAAEISLSIVPPVPYGMRNRIVIYPTKTGITGIETMWEAQTPPSRWVTALKSIDVDYVVVPHKSSQECFERAGINRSYKILTPGVDKKKFPFRPRGKESIFKFLTLGRMEPRKNPVVTMKAFKEAFPTKEYPHVGLVMKTRPDTVPTEVVAEKRKDPRICLIHHDLDEDKLIELYYACQAFVFPSRGEGFSFPPRHAICSGMPTIVTNNTAMADIPGAIPIDPDSYSAMSKCGYSDGEEQRMLMADIDYHKVAAAMLDVYENYEEHVEKARAGAEQMMSWDEFPQHFQEVFSD